jgi:hypothetical protein
MPTVRAATSPRPAKSPAIANGGLRPVERQGAQMSDSKPIDARIARKLLAPRNQ